MSERADKNTINDFAKVGEGIYKKDNAISIEECNYIYNFMLNNKNNPLGKGEAVPWDPANGNVLYYVSAKDRTLLDIINKHKEEMTATLRSIHGEEIYPHLTTIVLWKPGQIMGRHVDNGAQTDHERTLEMRKYTSVAYMNDDFEGGETFIRSDGKTEPNFRTALEYGFPNDAFSDYISKPKQGTVVLFGANDENAHGVTKLLTGTRVILSIWFTTNPQLQESVL